MPAVVMSTVVVKATVAQKATILGLLVLVSIVLAVWTKTRLGRGPDYT